MKTLKTLLSAFAMVALFATTALAQGQASIAATADVVTDVTLTGEQNLAFGSMTDTEADAGVAIALTDPVAELGKFTLGNVANTQDIIMTISAPDALSPTGTPTFAATPDDLPLELAARYTENEADPSGTNTQLFTWDGTFTSGEASATTGATTAYVYVAGEVGGVSGNYQGQYSGDITLSVYYD